MSASVSFSSFVVAVAGADLDAVIVGYDTVVAEAVFLLQV